MLTENMRDDEGTKQFDFTEEQHAELESHWLAGLRSYRTKQELTEVSTLAARTQLTVKQVKAQCLNYRTMH